jgi:hypothetical protein
MTISKSQGLTLEPAVLYPPSPIFPHSQLYMAFSLPCLRLTASLLQLLEGIDSVHKVTD